MKIGTKLIGSFLIVAAICAVVGAIGLLGLHHTGVAIEEIGVVRLPSVQSLLVVKEGGTAIKVAQRTFLNPNLDNAEFQRQMDNITAIRERYEAAWKVYEPLPQTPEEAELWKQLVPAWDAWRTENNKFFTFVKQAREMDLGNPYILRGDTERFRGDHYAVASKLVTLINENKTFDGGEDDTLCNFGKWLSSFKTNNPEFRRLMEQVRQPHHQFHQCVVQIKQLVKEGNTAAAQSKYQETIHLMDEQIVPVINQMIALAAQAEDLTNQAYALTTGTLRETQNKANDLLDKIIDINTALAATAVTDGAADAAKAQWTSISAVTLGVLLAVGFGIFIARSLTKPIRFMVDRLKDIAQGEGDLTQRVDETRKDELGELGRWFNTFVKKIHDIIAEVSGVTREVASAATEIASSSEEMAGGMKQQTEQTTQVSSAVEEMSSTVMEVARKSSEAAATASEAGKQANEGGTVVNQTIDDMRTIAQMVNQTGIAINELGKRGEQIGQVIEVINDIADQTNLLALNAAIEAARAGEHGKGFAVVADEVRKLAERTTQATEEVAESIKAIQSETASAVQQMNTGTQRVNEGVTQAERAGGSLKAIVEGSKRVAEMIQSIAAASEEQSAAAEQISRNVESINAVTRQSSEGADQAASAAAQLSAKAEQLQQLVGQFKLAA